jgi:hypothetical protein
MLLELQKRVSKILLKHPYPFILSFLNRFFLLNIKNTKEFNYENIFLQKKVRLKRIEYSIEKKK